MSIRLGCFLGLAINGFKFMVKIWLNLTLFKKWYLNVLGLDDCRWSVEKYRINLFVLATKKYESVRAIL